MKNLLTALLFQFFFVNIMAQTVTGRIREIAINEADSSVWLASNAGLVYWIKDFNNDIKVKLRLPEPVPDYFGEKKINIEHITFFNKDTLFISGYLGNDLIGKQMGKPNMIFLSNNGGHDWVMKSFDNAGMWVYDCFSEKNGNAWIGGSNGKIYYSGNFANNWKKISSPFNNKSRLGCIDKGMKVGVIGSTANGIKLSFDNFKTFKKIDTPFDTKAYFYSKEEMKRNYIFNEINSIKVIGDTTIIANQENFVFYSNINQTLWKKFDPEISKFSSDNSSGKIIGLTNNNQVISFNTNLKFEKNVIKLNENETILDIKAINANIYILATKYFPKKKGEDVVGTFGNTKVVEVGYRKASHYIVYRINNDGVKKMELEIKYEK